MWVDRLRQVRRLIARNRLGVALVTGFMGAAVGSTAAVVALLHAFVFNQVPSGRGAEIVHVIGLAFRTPGESATAWWRRAPSLDRLASYVSGIAEVDSPDGWRPVRATVVSADFFAVFAANPLSGRFFQPSDEDAAPLGAAVISQEFWKGYGASRPSIIGEQLRVGDGYVLVRMRCTHARGRRSERLYPAVQAQLVEQLAEGGAPSHAGRPAVAGRIEIEHADVGPVQLQRTTFRRAG